MRTRVLLVVLLVASVCILLIWAFRPVRVHHPSPAAPEVATKRAAKPIAAPAADEGEQGEVARPAAAGDVQAQATQNVKHIGVSGVSLNATQEASAQASNLVQQLRRTVNSPIEFYGKVIDENGMGLERASVAFECQGYPEYYFATNVLTASNGTFALNSTTGAVLYVRVSKDGYREVKGSNQNRFIYAGLLAYESERFRPDSNNPVIFRLGKH